MEAEPSKGELTPEDIRRLHDEARALRMSITWLTQTAAERRRHSVLFLAVGIWLTIWAHDQHVEHCVADGPTSARGEFICDVTFPLHNHSNDRSFILGDGPDGHADHGTTPPSPRPDSDDYPVDGQALGMVVYLTGLGIGIRWAYRARPRNEI